MYFHNFCKSDARFSQLIGIYSNLFACCNDIESIDYGCKFVFFFLVAGYD